MLTEQQIGYFQTFGFLIFRQLFTPEEVDALTSEFRHGMESAYRHAPFDGTRRYWRTMLDSETPLFSGLLEDLRFCEPAEQLFGDDVIGCCVDANRYIADTDWHPDSLNPDPTMLKFVFYLQPLDGQTGALRVIPGSHHPAVFQELHQHLRQCAPTISDIPAYVFDSSPGDVLAFDVRLWHASAGGSTDRWMCTMFYERNPTTPEEEAEALEHARGQIQLPAAFDHPNDPYYPPQWLANPQENPRRRRWIERMRELGFFEPVQ